MKYFVIPPMIVLYCIVSAVLFHFVFDQYNVIVYPFNVGGVLFVFFGFSLMGKARVLFKKYNTTLDFQESDAMVTEGVYLKTRNPMYIGMASVIMGISVGSMNVVSLVLPFLFCLYIHWFILPVEEKLLRGKFGKYYDQYVQKVRRWI